MADQPILFGGMWVTQQKKVGVVAIENLGLFYGLVIFVVEELKKLQHCGVVFSNTSGVLLVTTVSLSVSK